MVQARHQLAGIITGSSKHAQTRGRLCCGSQLSPQLAVQVFQVGSQYLCLHLVQIAALQRTFQLPHLLLQHHPHMRSTPQPCQTNRHTAVGQGLQLAIEY